MTCSHRRRLIGACAVLTLSAFATACGNNANTATTPAASDTPAQKFAAGTTMAKLQKQGEITIGVKYDVPPFGFKNPRSGSIEGFDIDFGKAIADQLGAKPKFVEALSDNRIPFIKDGTVDLVLSTMTINPERAKEIGFTNPYFIAHGRILQKKGGSIKSVADLAGKKVCTALGSTYEDTLKKQAPKADLKLVDSYSECLELIQNGAVDAVSTDDVILTGMIIQDKSLELVKGQNLTTEPYGGGLKKGDTKFRTFLDGVLKRYTSGDAWAKAYAKWLGRFTGEKQSPPTANLQDALAGKIQ